MRELLQTAGAGPHQARPVPAQQTAEEDHQAAARVPGGDLGQGECRHQRGGRQEQKQAGPRRGQEGNAVRVT